MTPVQKSTVQVPDVAIVGIGILGMIRIVIVSINVNVLRSFGSIRSSL